MTALATRSDDTAVSGGMLKKSTSTGVINAPPPMPVRPTTIPMPNAAIASRMSGFIRYRVWEESVSLGGGAMQCQQYAALLLLDRIGFDGWLGGTCLYPPTAAVALRPPPRALHHSRE